jgi:hypothetical protein
MIRRSHILTTAALLAVCATPASAATWEDLHSTGTTGDAAPPPSSIAASAADEYQQLRSEGTSELGRAYGSPDAADAARAAEPAEQYVLDRKFGSPDAADAGNVPPSEPGQYVLDRKFGSPDAVDAARDLPPVTTTAPVVEVRGPSGGFDWGDAGIGAAGMLALFSIAAGSALLLTGRKRRQAGSVATQ